MKYEQSLRDPQNNIKHTNLCIMSQWGGERENRTEKTLEK